MSSDRLTTHYDSQHGTEIDVDEEASLLLGRWASRAQPQLCGGRGTVGH